MHNGVFDIACIYHSYGHNLTNALHADTILMKHTVDEERPFGLKEIALMCYGEEAVDEQADLKENVISKGGKWNRSNKDMYMADLDIIGKYAIKDTLLTFKLYEDFNHELEEQNLLGFFYEKEVMPLYREATIPMKLNGVYVNQKYFEKLKKEIESDIIKLTGEVFELIKDDIEPFVREILDKNVRTSRSGQFAHELLQLYEIPVPLNKKTGKPTFAKSALQALKADYPEDPAVKFLLEEGDLPEDIIYEVKKAVFTNRKPELPFVFNLSSAQQLSWLLFECYGEEPTKYSKQTGEPTVDKNALKEYEHLEFVKPLLELKKLEKLLSTYISPILEKNHEGKIFPSMLQFGTTSGRYSCSGGLNLQTLPRDDTRIKKGFIAPEGYSVVAADFSSLEPRIFSWVSGDEGLKEVYKKDLDLYSKIAIDVFGLSEYSAKEGDPNFLKDVNKDMRALSKTFTLAVPYGSGAGRIAALMGKEYQDAKEIIDDYLNAYPRLKDYMKHQEKQAYKTGKVHTSFGRVRHLPKAKALYDVFKGDIFNKKKLTAKLKTFKTKSKASIEDLIEAYEPNNASKITDIGRLANELYYEFRNLLNNAKNFPIQATAAHVTNASLIKLSKSLKRAKIDGWICLQVHDEVVCIVKNEHTEEAARLLKDAMENNWVTKKIDIPMVANPIIGKSFAEAKD